MTDKDFAAKMVELSKRMISTIANDEELQALADKMCAAALVITNPEEALEEVIKAGPLILLQEWTKYVMIDDAAISIQVTIDDFGDIPKIRHMSAVVLDPFNGARKISDELADRLKVAFDTHEEYAVAGELNQNVRHFKKNLTPVN